MPLITFLSSLVFLAAEIFWLPYTAFVTAVYYIRRPAALEPRRLKNGTQSHACDWEGFLASHRALAGQVILRKPGLEKYRV